MKTSESSKMPGPPRTRGMREVRAAGSPLNREVLLPAERFIYSETISGVLLLVCAIAALVWANSPLWEWYFALRDTPVSLQIGGFSLAIDLQHWINDGLMAVFFFVVALEIKRELIHGVLGSMLAMRRLGFRSALAYLFPAVLFWVAMLKSGVHATVAGVILGAITPAKSLGRKSTFVETVRDILPDVRDSLDKEKSERDEVMLGRIEELAHQTESPLERLERMVHPWTSYLVLPLCALVNTGVALSAEFVRQAFTSAVTWGAMAGLLAGKVAGVAGFSWQAVRLGWAALPGGAAWRHIVGAGLIGGVGFTVSLFITGLAFSDNVLVEEAKVGVLAASLIAGLAGYSFLLLMGHENKPGEQRAGGA